MDRLNCGGALVRHEQDFVGELQQWVEASVASANPPPLRVALAPAEGSQAVARADFLGDGYRDGVIIEGIIAGLKVGERCIPQLLLDVPLLIGKGDEKRAVEGERVGVPDAAEVEGYGAVGAEDDALRGQAVEEVEALVMLDVLQGVVDGRAALAVGDEAEGAGLVKGVLALGRPSQLEGEEAVRRTSPPPVYVETILVVVAVDDELVGSTVVVLSAVEERAVEVEFGAEHGVPLLGAVATFIARAGRGQEVECLDQTPGGCNPAGAALVEAVVHLADRATVEHQAGNLGRLFVGEAPVRLFVRHQAPVVRAAQRGRDLEAA